MEEDSERSRKRRKEDDDPDSAFWQKAFALSDKAVEKHKQQCKSVPFQLSSPKRGRVAVAKYVPGKPQVRMKGYRNVLIHTSANTLGGALSPYQLKNEFGHFLETLWQFAKQFGFVDAQRTPKSRFTPDQIIWEHPSEVHIGDDGEPNDAYWEWRRKGMTNFYPVRYPNGFSGKKRCICSIVTREWLNDPEKTDPSAKSAFPLIRLSLIEARKTIYFGEYARLAPKHPEFLKLKKMHDNGENLLILEVDGPPIDQKWRGHPYDKVTAEQPGLILDESIIEILLNDPSLSFGHGYTIGALLLGKTEF